MTTSDAVTSNDTGTSSDTGTSNDTGISSDTVTSSGTGTRKGAAIPNRTWRAVAIGAVAAADVVVALVASTWLPGFLPISAGVLAITTLWAVARPAGWGPLALLVAQLFCLGATGAAPETAGGWALAAAAASAMVVTHLALALLGSWPRRVDLPRETARRWAVQAAALVWVGIAAAGVGALATVTPQGWAPWLGAVALVLLAGLLWQLRGQTRKG